MLKKICLIDYGAGNLRSIENALAKLGGKAETVTNPGNLAGASAIILPGVGNFGAAMEKLESFRTPIKRAVNAGTPFLGVCLGIQVIFDESDESPGVAGLGLIPGTCKRFPENMKVPHIGWNTININKETPLLNEINTGSFYYFVHSYYSVPTDEEVIAGETDYGNITFPSIIIQDNIHATQFHPERSGEKGLKLLANFLELIP